MNKIRLVRFKLSIYDQDDVWTKEEFTGVFHGIYQSHQPEAVVEDEDGYMHIVPLDDIQFVKPLLPDLELKGISSG